jgi:homocitrate synthase
MLPSDPANRPAPRPVSIVETTLREGEQFAYARFSSSERRALAQALDAFGVEYIELTSPAASPQSHQDLATIAALGLRARILTHVRCHIDDVTLAVQSGAQGVNMLFATSAVLRRNSHGRSIDAIIEEARAVIGFAQRHDVEIRFSCEDAFRTDLDDLIRVYRAVDALGVQRVGVADTVGIATPRQVHEVVSAVRAAVGCDIEWHGHNDGGCAIANAYSAYEAGATHIDVSVLGIGERNGIASLSGWIARLATVDPLLVAHYRVEQLLAIDRMVAELVGVDIPFNQPITGPTAFSHKAGLHTKAVLSDPSSYEVLDPARFGRERHVHVAHRLTGWHAIAERARQLGLVLGEAQARKAAAQLKALADEREVTDEDLEQIILGFAE